MRKSIGLAFAVGLAVTVMVPETAQAQRRDREERARREQQRIEQVRRERQRIGQVRRERRGNGRTPGPAFCRSGAGHPVFGRAWCRDKGFGLGDYDSAEHRRNDDRRRDDDRLDRRDDRRRDGRLDGRDPTWRRTNWGEVRFRIGDALSGRELNEDRLADLIGARNVARISRHAYELGADGRLGGVWQDDRPLVLRVYAGRVPIVEFIDENQDRRVDIVRLAYYR